MRLSIIIFGFLFVSVRTSDENCGAETEKQCQDCDKSDGVPPIDDEQSVQRLQEAKLRYLPEFNVHEDKYNRWKSYIDQIREANFKYIAEQQAEKMRPDIGEWSNSSCGAFVQLVDSDLRYFEQRFGRNFITAPLVQRMIDSKRAIHYQIIDHRLYRDRSCMFPSRCEGVEHFLAASLSSLPNMDLFVNVRDYPQVGTYFSPDQQFPIFSFSKQRESYADITYPAWTFWSGGPALDIYPIGIGRWDLMRNSILKQANRLSWSQKRDIAFFRGSRTSAQRDPIVLLSRSRPDLVDAKYTKNQAWKSSADTLGDEPAATVSFEDHCQYKYLFNAHGVAASFRLKHLFLCRSLVLNVHSDWIEFFYPPLKPWIHYVPISHNFSDAERILNFLAENQPIAANIAKRGYEFIRHHITLDSVECYWRFLLQSYSDRLVSHRPTQADDDLIEIKMKKNR